MNIETLKYKQGFEKLCHDFVMSTAIYKPLD